MEVTSGLVESNGSSGGWLKVICRLTACTSRQLWAQRLVTKMGKLYFLLYF